MCMEKTPWERVREFHGHVCPGLAQGFRATELALQKLGTERSVDEELVAIVENDACGTDAVQILTGCTFGKGNLFFLDHGKQVYTIASRDKEQAVRIAVRYGAFHNPELGRLRELVNKGEATEEQKKEFSVLQQLHIKNILESGEDCFDISFVKADIPPRASIHRSLRCENCGEAVMETRTMDVGGKKVCIPCSKKQSD
ncbi:MAG: FmdE family protein [Bacillota bacterium]